jgi:polysaccharide deacetylase family protein (PEP-CTERM system associated)
MSDRDASLVNAMTVDVEDYFHVTAFASVLDRSNWDSLEYRAVPNTRRVLELFEKHDIRATFFVLGWVAARSPEIVREIAAAGHEVACHGMTHELVFNQTRETFRRETRESKQRLEDLTGRRVRGYRAASYSITVRSLWALDELVELGFEYDSSIFPIRHDIYGMPEAPRHPYRPDGRPILEIPLTTVELFGRRLPCAGGGYFRLLPYSLFKWALERVNRVDHLPAVFYFHPWEVDPDQPRIKAGWRSTFRHYMNLSRTEPRLNRLLADLRWDSMANIFVDATPSNVNWPSLATAGASA